VLPLRLKKPFEVTRLHADELVGGKDGNRLFFMRQSVTGPNEIAAIDVADWQDTSPDLATAEEAKREAKAVTHMNDGALSDIDMQPLESFKFKGAKDALVQGFMIKPPGFDPSKKYPVKFLIVSQGFDLFTTLQRLKVPSKMLYFRTKITLS
jgi:dipeptidyl aminopeptidase/acylaminoacyl peptidase